MLLSFHMAFQLFGIELSSINETVTLYVCLILFAGSHLLSMWAVQEVLSKKLFHSFFPPFLSFCVGLSFHHTGRPCIGVLGVYDNDLWRLN